MGKMLVSRGLVLLRAESHLFNIIAGKGIDVSIVGTQLRIEKPLRAITHLEKQGRAAPAWVAALQSYGQSLLVPIFSHSTVVGYLSLGPRFQGKYSRTDTKLIQSLVNLSGAAIEKALIIDQVRDANRNLDRKYQELNTLFDLGKELNVGLDQDHVIRLVTFALMGQIGVQQYAICLRTEAGISVAASRLHEGPPIEQELVQLSDLKKAERIEDLLRSKAHRAPAAALSSRGISVVVPLHIQNQIRGFVVLGERLRGGEYTREDLEYLYSLGNLVIISLENARLFQEAIEKQRMEDELTIAREIQQGLLPERIPEIPGFDVAAVNISSKQVGGDYYDVLQRKANEYVIAIGDVSGKGMPAALLMANVQAALRALAPLSEPLPVTTARMNDLTCVNTRGGSKFITFFWGVLEAQKKELRYVNAGHNPPLLLRANGNVERLEAGGIILGVVKTGTPYAEAATVCRKGDLLVLYTDGVSEAMNAEGVDFTEERLLEVLKQNRESTAHEVIQHVLRAIEEHTRGTPQSDDITMLVMRSV